MLGHRTTARGPWSWSPLARGLHTGSLDRPLRLEPGEPAPAVRDGLDSGAGPQNPPETQTTSCLWSDKQGLKLWTWFPQRSPQPCVHVSVCWCVHVRTPAPLGTHTHFRGTTAAVRTDQVHGAPSHYYPSCIAHNPNISC